MISTDDLHFFAAVARATSLAAAARDLNVSAPAVTQRLRSLEERLGVHLVIRSGRGLTLTDEGELLADQGRHLIGSIEKLEQTFAERRGEVTGHLRIVGPLGFGPRHVSPVVAEFRTKYPRVQIDLVLSDRLGRIPEESWDVAIHVGEAKDITPTLNRRVLAPNLRVVCAAPEYLAQHPAPIEPGDLHAHICIALRENDEDTTLWRFETAEGEEIRVRVEPQLASNAGEIVRSWALAGLGIIVRSEWDVADDIRAGRLVPLLQNYGLPEAPVVALFGSRRNARAQRSHLFVDSLVTSLNPPPWRQRDPR